MQQWEGLAQPVILRPTGDLEPHTPVKAHGLVVLLIHIHPSGAQCLDSISEQPASDPLAAPVRMDE